MRIFSVVRSYSFSERHRKYLLHHIRMGLIDRSGLADSSRDPSGSGEPQSESSLISHYNGEVQVVEVFLIIEDIMRRRYNITVCNS